jgi:hypothetical protein
MVVGFFLMDWSNKTYFMDKDVRYVFWHADCRGHGGSVVRERYKNGKYWSYRQRCWGGRW